MFILSSQENIVYTVEVTVRSLLDLTVVPPLCPLASSRPSVLLTFWAEDCPGMVLCGHRKLGLGEGAKGGAVPGPLFWEAGTAPIQPQQDFRGPGSRETTQKEDTAVTL